MTLTPAAGGVTCTAAPTVTPRPADTVPVSRTAGATLAVSGSAFSDNRAIGGAGTPGIGGWNRAGGAIWNGGNSVLVVTYSTFTRNQALGGDGGDGGTYGQGVGGGVHVRGGTTSVNKTRIWGNDAPPGHDDVFGDLIDLGEKQPT